MTTFNFDQFISSDLPQGTMITLNTKRGGKLYKFIGIANEESLEEVIFTDGTISEIVMSHPVVILRGKKGLIAMEESELKKHSITVL